MKKKTFINSIPEFGKHSNKENYRKVVFKNNDWKRNVNKKLMFSGIAGRLILTFLIPVSFVIIIGIVSYQKASTAIVNNYKKSSLQAVDMTGEYIKFGLESVKATAIQYIMDSNLQKYLNGGFLSDPVTENLTMRNIQTEIIAKQVSDEFIGNIHILSDKNGMLTTSSQSDDELYQEFIATSAGNPLKQKSSATYWIGCDTLVDSKLKVQQESYVLRYIKGFTDAKACIIFDISSSTIEKILRNLDFGKGSIVGFVTADGRELLLSDNNSGLENGNIFTSEKLYGNSAQNSGSLTVKWKGQNYLYLYTKMDGSGAMICALIPQSILLEQVNEIKQLTIVLIILASIIAILVGLKMAAGIQNVINYIIGELKKVSDGNLMTRLNVRRKDEFLTLSDGINDMVENMRALIEKVKCQSGSVAKSAVQVKEASTILFEASKNIINSIDEIQQGVSQQASDTENCLHQMDDLSSKIETVYGKSNEINSIANSTKNSIVLGVNDMLVLNEKAQSTSVITKQIIQNTDILEKKSMSIDKIIKTINEIATETNLLSLNAAIEAARAGEYGHGFTVVADQIRKLADESIVGVHEIETLIKEIQHHTKKVVEITKNAEKTVSEQEIAVNNVKQSFSDMNHHVDGLVNDVDMIFENVHNIELAKKLTLEAVENIAAVSQETAAASTNVYETTNHQFGAVSSLTTLSKELDDNSTILQTIIQRFIVE